jgi:ribosome maturation factor RimP
MAIADRISALINPELEALGYELVRVQYMGGGSGKTLQIMADRADGKPMLVDDCEVISNRLSEVLDVADPVQENYVLEVSSPGIDRPLTRLKDFARFEGFEAKVQLRNAQEGQRNFSGKLCGVEGEDVNLEIPGTKKTEAKRLRFPFAEVEAARLVMTDELLKAAALAQSGQDQ